MRIARFEDILAWQRARSLVSLVYRETTEGRSHQDFGYRNQLRRASVSVMTNIAEGFARDSRIEFARFLDIARASAREVQSLLYVGVDIGYIDDARFNELYELSNVTAYLVNRLRQSLSPNETMKQG